MKNTKNTLKKDSKSFVQSLIAANMPNTLSKGSYVKKNENWQFSVARVMLTGILKNQFYRDANEAAKEALPLMVFAAKKDPAYLLKAAGFARDVNMKGMVKLGIAALACNASDEFLNQNREDIIYILKTFHPGQLLEFVELCKSKVLGRGFGARTQKWIQAVMESWSSNLVEVYTLKYPKAFKALLRLVHPNYTGTKGKLVRYLLDTNKEHKDYGTASGSKQIAVEQMKSLKDSKKIAQLMLEHEVPWDVVKGFHPVKGDVGLAMMTQMGLSALLLNVRSLEKNGILFSDDALEAFKMKLNEVKNGRSIPIDFAKPYIYSSSQKVKSLLVNAITETLEKSTPEIEGRNIGVSVDISGSMDGEALITAGLLSVPFLKAKNLWFTTFDTELYEDGMAHCPRIKGQKRTDQVKRLLTMHTHGATDVGISLRKAISNNIKLDLHIIITDEQQNSGTPLMTVWREYKKKVNPRAELWIINATNYPWHSADFKDPSVTVYQTMTPAIFRNLQFVGQDLVSAIENFEIKPKNINNEEDS